MAKSGVTPKKAELFLKLNDAKTFDKVSSFLKSAFSKDDSDRFFQFDSAQLQININVKFAELEERVYDHDRHLAENYQIYKFPLQYTDDYIKSLSQSEKIHFDNALKKREIKSYVDNIKKLRASSTYQDEIISEEKLIKDCQVIIVKANHNNPESQKWIINHIDDLKKNHNLYLLPEFVLEREKLDVNEMKAYLRSDLFRATHEHETKGVTKEALKMIDIVNKVGQIQGGEDLISIIINGKYIERRLLYTDASFSKKINIILKKDPKCKIIVWAGSAHAEGILKNLLAESHMSCGSIYPGETEPCYRMFRQYPLSKYIDIIDTKAPLKNEATAARENFIQGLRGFLAINSAKISDSDFKEICRISNHILLLRQQYDLKKSPWRQTHEAKVMTVIEKQMIDVLRPAQGVANDIRSSMAKVMHEQISNLEKKELGSTFYNYLNGTLNSLNHYYPLLPNELKGLGSALTDTTNTVRNNMVKALLVFREENQTISDHDYQQICLAVQEILLIRQDYDADKIKSFSEKKNNALLQIEAEVLAVLRDKDKQNSSPQKKIERMIKQIDDQLTRFQNDKKTFYHLMETAKNKLILLKNNNAKKEVQPPQKESPSKSSALSTSFVASNLASGSATPSSVLAGSLKGSADSVPENFKTPSTASSPTTSTSSVNQNPSLQQPNETSKRPSATKK